MDLNNVMWYWLHQWPGRSDIWCKINRMKFINDRFNFSTLGAATGLHQSYHPHSFVKCCYMFCNIYLMFKGADIIFLSAHLMFLVVVFMYY